MTRKTLLARIYKPTQLKHVERSLEGLLEGLNVKADVLGAVSGRWPQIEISGEDEGIATKYLAREIGFCPEKVQAVQEDSILKGYVVGLHEEGEGLVVDIGVFEPAPLNGIIQLRHLQEQLAGEKPFDIKKIVKSYGLCRGIPLELKVTEIDQENNRLRTELSTTQILRYNSWIESLLDRFIVVGATESEVRKALNDTGLKRDITDVKSLGLLEHALTCKLGTDAKGLVSIVGRRLRNARFTMFNSHELWNS